MSPSALPELAPPVAGGRQRADELIRWLRTYADERVNSRLIDERRSIPPHLVLDFGNHGVLGLHVPVELGGLGLDHRDAMRIVEQLAGIDLSLATLVVNHNFLGIRPIQRHGPQLLRDELVPVLAQGRQLAAFALTEEGAGSNPQALSASGVADGAGGWRLRGSKIWSGSASWAGVINVFVKVVPDGPRPAGITAFAVRAGARGLRHGSEALTTGMRGMVQNAVQLDDIAVGRDELLGEVGAGMHVAQDAMTFTRLAIGAKSLGAMKRCLQLMHRHASRRSIATGRLLDNPVTLARMSDSVAATAALEALVGEICLSLDRGREVPMEAYIACKTTGPEFLWRAADDLVQLLGGRGYIETNLAPQVLRDARVLRIFEGPTEPLSMFLGLRVLHQSAALHEYLRDDLAAPAVSDRLRVATREINALHREQTLLGCDRVSASRWSAFLLGDVASHAILWAALEHSGARSSRLDARALEWIRGRFDQRLASALAAVRSRGAMLSADEATSTVSSYGETIGELEQALPGEDHEVDAYLRRDPR